MHPADFEALTCDILSVARICCPGRVVSVLEGGYGSWKFHKQVVPVSVGVDASGEEGVEAGSDDDGADGTSGGAGAAAGAGSVTMRVPFLHRETLADNCIAHVRALVHDGDVDVSGGGDVAGGEA